MRDLLISLNSNNLKLSYCGPEGCGGIVSEISSEVVDDTKILDKERFTEDLIALSHEVLPKGKKPDGVSYLISPDDVYISFVTVNKGNGDPDEQVIAAIKEKIDTPLEDLYFSYSKIAPFVYQFVAVSKEYIEDLLEVSNLWGVPVKGVVPWVSLLPKTLHDADPAIFVATQDEKYVVSLSELNGVYFASSYDEEKSSEELAELVKTLSVYNRKSPIRRIFTLNSDLGLDEDYEVLPVLNGDSLLSEGFEVHELYLHILQNNPALLNSQVNLLNLLPLPEPANRSKVLVPAGAAVLLVGLLVGSYFLFSDKLGLGQPTEDVAGAASEVVEVQESTASNDNGGSDGGGHSDGERHSELDSESADLNKQDLSIRIENAAGINGAAGRTQGLLEEAGYTIHSIDTAENMRETTEILISPDFDAFRDTLVEDLGEQYPEAVVDVLEDSEAEYNVLILLGKNIEI
ncbi:hypothetical protein GF360_02640 [candidate division WWE3 bacterium]|nr:hypothetical protein [candidate division WWE3 bacterium]